MSASCICQETGYQADGLRCIRQKPVWERRALVFCVEMWGGGEKHGWGQTKSGLSCRGFLMRKTQPTQRGHTYHTTHLKTENRATKRKPKTSTWENSGGAREGERASWGLRVASSHTLWSDSDLESVTRPTGIRVPGRGDLSGLCFFQEDWHRRETCVGRYWSFKYLKIIFQILRRQWSFNTCLIIKMTTVSVFYNVNIFGH